MPRNDEATESVDINEILRRKYEERQAATVAGLVEALGTLPPTQVESTAEFEIPATLVPSPHYTDQHVIVTGLQVRVMRWTDPRNDEDGLGSIEVRMYAQRAKPDGTPDGRAKPGWMHGPEELAGPLLLAAHTRQPMPVKP